MTITRDRRGAPRWTPTGSDALGRLRLRGGREVVVVDLSATGALVEGDARFLPGTHVDVHVMTDAGRMLVRSRVIRAFVSGVASERITYRAGLAFDRQVGYALPRGSAATSLPTGSGYPPAQP